MNTTRKIYTSKASLCALGCYVRQQHLCDDVQTLRLPQKKDRLCPMGETDRYARPDSRRRDCDETA